MIPKELQKFGLTHARKPRARRLIACCVGETGTGKTSLALRTMPRPILIVNIDRNLEPLEENYVGQEDIYIKDIRLPRKINQDEDQKVWDEFRVLYETAVGKKLVRSVMIDTLDATYDLLRRAKLGTLDFGEAPQSAFSTVNSAMKWIHSYAKDNDVNLLCTHRPTNEFKEVINPRTGKRSGQATGRRKRAGWKDAEFEAQMCFELSKDEATSGIDKYKLTINKCTGNPEAEDPDYPMHELTGGDISWKNLLRIAYPNADEAEFE